MDIVFPNNFPNNDEMINVLHKTIEKSWKIEMDIKDIERWLDNFSGKVYDVCEEKRLALWLLCNYTFYCSDDINHLCGVLFRNFVHDFIIRNNLQEKEDIEQELKKVCFSSIGSASESGGLLLYHFRQEAKISLDRFFYPTAIDSRKENTLVFIDDVTLSGGTALRNFYENLNGIPNKGIYYLTIIASEKAVRKIAEKGIIVISCFLVDDRNQCFSDKSMLFHRFPELKDITKEMVQKYGEIIAPDEPLGYKNGEYCFGFYYNTPNNTLPIFWSKNNWHPIFERKEKLQNAQQFHFPTSKYI